MLETLVADLIPPNDEDRVEALKQYDFLYSLEDDFFDKILKMMAMVFGTPSAYISLVEKEYVQYKSANEPFCTIPVPRKDSICSRTILGKAPLIIEDASKESALNTNPFVQAEEGVCFYAGAPLITPDGYHIGSICIVDSKPHQINSQQVDILVNFSRLVMDEIILKQHAHQQAQMQKELIKVQAQLTNGLEVGGITPWYWDLVDDKVYGGKELARLFGVTPEQTAAGLPSDILLQSIHPEDFCLIQERVAAAIQSGDKYEAEYRVFNLEKELRWVIARGSVQFEDGKPVSLTGSLIDITEKRKAENEILDKERELEFVTENLPQLVWVTKANGDAYYFNQQWFQYSGLTQKDLAGDKWASLLHPDDAQRTLEVWQESREQVRVYEVEYRLKRYDGIYRWFLARGIPMKDDKGVVIKWFGTTTDIEEQKKAENDLKRFRYMANHAQDSFILMRKDGTFAYLNPKAVQSWGYTEEEAKKLRVPDVDPVFDESAFADIFQKVQEGLFPKVETLHKHKNGHIYPVEVNMGALTLDGEPHMFAVARDITERKAAEIALQQSTERFDLVAKATQDAIWDWNLETNEVWWNEGFKNLFQYKEEEIEKGAESWYNRIHPDDATRIVGGIHKIIDNGGSQWSDEYRFRKANGSYAIVLDRGYALHNEKGKPVRMLGSMQDITDRKQYEEAIRQSEARTRLAIQAASLGTFELDFTNNVFHHSPRTAEIFGFDPSLHVSNTDLVQRIHPDDNALRLKAHDIALQTGNLSYEVRLIHPDKSIHWVRIIGLLINTETNPWLIGIVLDVTEEKRASELLEQKILERTEELQAANEQLKQFSYAASHDLQEPLRKISIFTDRLMAAMGETMDEESLRLAERIQQTTNRMRTLINDLLNYSNTSMRQVVQENVNINQLLEEVVEDMDTLISEAGAELRIETLPLVTGDKIQLRQLFHNLLTNAIKYHKPGVHPLVEINGAIKPGSQLAEHSLPSQSNQSFYHLTIKDNGIGFDQEYADRIFGLFQRLHGRSEYEGTGIGLAICKKVVENHHGTLWAESKPGVGTTFHIALPI